MEFVKIEGQDQAGIVRLSKVASAIIREYYDPLLGTAQNDYMLEKFQSVHAVTEQLREGYRYYIVRHAGTDIGFIGYYPKGELLYLSKFYLCREARGHGFGREMLAFLYIRAAEEGLSAIELNVNKYNPTIQVYEKMGFYRVRSEKNDIGHGYYMDDYVYRIEVPGNENCPSE